MNQSDGPAVPEREIVITPNRTLGLRALLGVFVAVAAINLGIGFGFGAFGVWAILPFAGLELLVAALGFLLLYRHAHDGERLLLRDGELEVVRRHGRDEYRHSFQIYWTRLVVVGDARGWYPLRLTLRSHGRELEIASGVSEEQRLELAKVLQPLLGQAYSPAC